MTTRQYLAALKKLGLSPHSNATRRLLGVSARSLAYMAKGDVPIAGPVALLLAMYVKHGLPAAGDDEDGGPSTASD